MIQDTKTHSCLTGGELEFSVFGFEPCQVSVRCLAAGSEKTNISVRCEGSVGLLLDTCYLSNYTVSIDLHSEKHKTQKWLQVYLIKKIPNCIKLLWDFLECKSFNIWKYFYDSKISRHFIHQCSELKEIIFTIKVIFQTHTFKGQELCRLFLWYLAQCLGLWIVCQTKLNIYLTL